jgi:predicted ribosome quality control (RQC) complex YloA/Tae2 family protein
MYDALTIAAIVDELNTRLVGARIQRLAHADPLTLVLELYANRRRQWLTLSADHDNARILLAPMGGERDADHVSPLILLLRKYARGGQILSVSQPRHERIVRISIGKAEATEEEEEPEDQEIVYSELVVELMGRRSNIMLLDEDGRIHDAIKRVPATMSRVRPILPGKQYVEPPPQNKQDPLIATAASVHAEATAASGDLDRWLVSNYLGMSPLLAREIEHRADVELENGVSELLTDDASRLASAIRDVFKPVETGQWSPHLYEFEDGGAEFSAIELLSLADREDVTTTAMQSVLDAAWQAWQLGPATLPGRGDRHAARRERLLEEIDNARDRVRQRLHSLREQASRADDAEQLREAGEMIYAYLWMIQPGMSELETPEGLTIKLDPTLSANENAQEYFERYRKSQSAGQQVPEMIEATNRQLAYLDQLHTMVTLAGNYDEIEAARLEWIDFVESTPGITRATRNRGARPAATARRPRQYRDAAGLTLLLGRTGQQNEAVTFDIASPDDLWLHARDVPGSHVILRTGGREPSPESLETAARLAAYYSNARNSTTVPVDITERRHVRKLKGAGPGMVTYRNETTLQVHPASEEDLGLTAP